MTTNHSFALKLDWARKHLEFFEQKTATWLKGDRYTLVDEPDPEPPLQPFADGYRARRFRIDRTSPIPDHLSLILGDCFSNLRSTLDHLALALAYANKPSLTDDEIINSEFPIYGRLTMKAHDENRRIGCIAPAARAIIKTLQPNYGGNDYRTHPLWQIHELNRINKHRTLQSVLPSPESETNRASACLLNSSTVPGIATSTSLRNLTW